MKKILTFSSIALFGIAVISGCIKSTNSSSGSSPSTIMTATIGGTNTTGGTAYSASNCEASLIGGEVSITGQSGSYPNITLGWASSSISTGTFTLVSTGTIGSSGQTYVTAPFPNPSSTVVNDYAVSGSVTVTSVSPNVAGTFSFTTAGGIVVSHGKFTSFIY